MFLHEAIGGLVFGALLGYVGFWALRSIDDYKVEVMITLAIVMGGYYLAGHLHVSGPLVMVVAGIITVINQNKGACPVRQGIIWVNSENSLTRF